MRVLILSTDYQEFLDWFYAGQPGLRTASYDEQLSARCDSLFGIADFHSRNMKSLGHDAMDVHFNNVALQAAWLWEFGKPGEVLRSRTWSAQQRIADAVKGSPLGPVLRRLGVRRRKSDWPYEVLSLQVQQFQPDVIINQSMDSVDPSYLKKLRDVVPLLVGFHGATPLSADKDFGCYDLVVSSFKPTVEAVREDLGIRSYLSPLAFDPIVLSRLPLERNPTIDLSFVGSFGSYHSSRTKFLEKVAERLPQLQVWAPSLDGVARDSRLHQCYRGPAWGRDMYMILRASKITLNHHGDVAPYANNSRLFEATGCGAMLVTDQQPNLSDLFNEGSELVAYASESECLDVIAHYVQHDADREEIAYAGQKRTLTEHTFMQRLIDECSLYESLLLEKE